METVETTQEHKEAIIAPENMEENSEAVLDISIGTKEKIGLQPKPVEIKRVMIKGQYKKSDNSLIGNRMVCFCKHPDKEELVQISAAKVERGKNLVIQGLWITLDEDRKLVKNSTVASLLNFVNAEKPRDLINKTFDTVLDDTNYLVLKAY